MRALLVVVLVPACLLVPAVPALAQLSAPVLVTQAVDNSVRTVLSGSLHPLARPEFDQGEAPPDLALQRMLLVLRRSPQQEAALERLIESQQYRNSASYHQWLTPQEFGAQFGLVDSDLAAVVDWLNASGFEVTQVSNGRTIIEFSGTAGLVKQAFGTAIHSYVVNGEQHWANASNVSIPAALAPVVAGINSLHNFRKSAHNNFVGTYSEQTKQLTPQPDYTLPMGQYTYYAVVPYDFAAIYDLLPLWNATPTAINGAGQTIAIVGRTDVDPTDATTFWNLFGLDGVNAPQPTVIITHNGPAPGINADEGEADIDIQWSGAAAPGATINFVTSESTETTDGVDLSALYIVDNNLAPVMSESYGLCELGLGTGGVSFYGALWEQAAAQGISVLVSSGDNGAAGCDNPGAPAQYGLNVNGLASTPYNAAVGGTDFNEYQKWSTYWNSTNNPTTQRSAKGYIPETTWNDSCTNALLQTLPGGSTNPETNCNNPNFSYFLESIAGSGGKSESWLKPTWQTGTQNDNARDLPDISLFASNGFLGSFYVVCQKDATGGVCNLNNFAGYGGTSVASPAFAGIMALVNQKTGSAQGVPGLVLYKLVSKQPNAFHDIPSGSTISVPCYTGTTNCTTSTAGHTYGVLSGYSTGTGYDLATGLGSVDAANLVNNWTKATFTPSTTTLTLNSGNPVSITHGASVPISIAVTPSTPTPTGDVALMVSPGTPRNPGIDQFTLSSGAVSSTTSVLPGGTYSVMAHYAGDPTYGGSYSSPVAVAVSPENSQPEVFLVTFDSNGNIISSDTTTAAYGSLYLLRVNIKNAAGQMCSPVGATNKTACPTGTVILTDNGNTLDAGTYTLNSLGYVEDHAIQLPGGTNAVTAAYAGDNSFQASATTVPLSITPASTTISQISGPTVPIPTASSYQIWLTVQTQSSGVAPTGTVSFYANGSLLPGTPQYYGYAANGSIPAFLNASLDVMFSTPGTRTITATYSGDSNYSAAPTSPSFSLSVLYPTTETISASSLNVPAGSSVVLTALVDTNVKNLTPTGTFTFYGPNGVINGSPIVTPVTDGNGNSALQATLTVTVSSTSGYSFQYSGDNNYFGGYSNSIVVAVPDFSLSPGSQQVTMTQGQSQTLTINVASLWGFSGAVGSFSCSGLPAETSCSFSPAQVTGSGSTTLTVATTPLGQLRQRAANESSGLTWIAIAMAPLLGVCLIGLPASQRGRGALRALTMLALAVLLLNCGGGSSSQPPPPPNPVPSISSLSPTQQAAGSQAQTLTINGSGFMNTSRATYNGAAHTVSFVSASQLSMALTQADLATTGNFPVVVTNPTPGGGSSGPVNFSVVTGTPTGTFNVTVTAISGPLTHTTTFTLIIQ